MKILFALFRSTGIPLGSIIRIIATAPKRYKSYYIEKRDWGRRRIAQPSGELKMLQRAFSAEFLERYRVHQSATAYASGRSILQNAAAHKDSAFILKLDFQNFFPSIRAMDWENFVAGDESGILDADDLQQSTRLLFWGDGTNRPLYLSIGAPTSPILSNILLFRLDCEIWGAACEAGLVYTRYADDITISGKSLRHVLEFEKFVVSEVNRLQSPQLKFNDTKRGVYGRGQRRLVTGLVLTQSGEVSIGRERKRLISALVHQFSLDNLDWQKTNLVKGLIAFSLSCEPDFVSRLRAKYGNEIIDKILKIDFHPRERVDVAGARAIGDPTEN